MGKRKGTFTNRNNKIEIEHLLALRTAIDNLVNELLTELIADQREQGKRQVLNG
jgi:hypothetical protein